MSHPIHQANKNGPFGDLTREEFYRRHRLLHQEAFMLDKHNRRIFTQTWRPASPAAELRGIVAMVHGYNSESSWIFQLTAVAVAKLGFLACALDLPGHGRSDGRRGHIPSIGPVIDDCIQFFDSVRAAHPHLPAFLYGESLGGAIAMLVCLERKDYVWDGLILNGAMCGVSAKFKPMWPLEKFLPLVTLVAPSWRVITKSLVEESYKEKWKRELVRRCPRVQAYEHPPASTALEFLRICKEIRRRCGELELPMLVLHGEEDSVCDSESAEMVYELAGSKDKTLRILPGAWHQLIGEPQETVGLGFGIIFSWLKDRTKLSSLPSSALL